MSFLERSSQLGALRSYAAEADAGHGRLVLVSGEAGIGKTTLVTELEDDAAPAGAQWWWTACDGMSTPRPLGPLADIAAQDPQLYAPCGDGRPRDVRFDALLAALRSGSALRVLVVEDVHWADEATLDMLRFLGRRIRTARALVLVTYRDDALLPDEPLRVTLGDLASHATTRRVALGPLSERAVHELAEGSGIDAARLYQLTDGNPFFVHEVLAGGSLAMPSSARDVVLARAAALPSGARRALDAASLAGPRVETALLSTAASLAPGDLDDALLSGLLTRDGDALRFRHEIARRAVHDEIAPHTAAQVHRALLSALLADGCADDARLAFHADAAGESSVALRHATLAGRAAAAVASHREAAAQFARAVRHLGSADIVRCAELHDEFADELSLVERWDDAADARRTAIGLWRAAGDRLREGAAEMRLGSVMWRLCRGADALAAYGRARELLEPLGPSEALCALYCGGADAAEPAAQESYIRLADAMSRELDVPSLRCRALNSIAFLAAGHGGDYETPLREALALALQHRIEPAAGQSYANLTESFQATFRLPETESFFLEALAYCDEHDVAIYGNCTRGHYAMALADHGRWDEALRQAGIVLSSPVSPINRLSSLATIGVVYARRGDERAADYLAQAQETAAGTDEPVYLAWAGLPAVEAAWLAGDVDTARTRLAMLHDRLTAFESSWLAAVIAWEHRLGVGTADVPASSPYAAQIAGPPGRAAAIWDAMSLPWHAALALGDSADPAELREAVRRLDALSPPAAQAVRRRMRELGFRSTQVGARPSTRDDPHGLTRREREVFELIRGDLTNEQIAARLVISVKTVDHHVSAVLAKLGVRSRRAASALARR